MLTFALAASLSLAALGAAEPDPVASAPVPVASAAPPALREPLREIGHVHALSGFCAAFLGHFNTAARAMLGNDQTLTFVDFTLGGLEPHFKAKGGEVQLYDDRVRLGHYTDDIFKAIPALQSEIDQLRRSAELSKDPEQAKAARETATELQQSLDRQKAMAGDSLGVVHALMDMALGATNDLAVRSRAGGPPSIGAPEVSGPAASTNYIGSVASNSNYTQSTPEQRRDVRSYLQFDKQFDRIAQAESAAVAHAQAIAAGC
jgi:hypothetical protein